MSQDQLSALVGNAWEQHRKNNNEEALRMFDEALAQDGSNVDAHYGKGLALRELKRQEDAIATLRQAHTIATNRLEQIRAENEADGTHIANNLNMTEDDRYMMLIRMIGQRLQELGVDITIATF